MPQTFTIDLTKAELSPEKAKKILHDKEVKGHALTDKQRKFMGAVASGSARKSEELEKAKYTKRTGTPGNYKYTYAEPKKEQSGRSSIRVGSRVEDPLGRRVTVTKVEGDDVTVRLGGSYGATVKYPASTLKVVGSTDHLKPPTAEETARIKQDPRYKEAMAGIEAKEIPEGTPAPQSGSIVGIVGEKAFSRVKLSKTDQAMADKAGVAAGSYRSVGTGETIYQLFRDGKPIDGTTVSRKSAIKSRIRREMKKSLDSGHDAMERLEKAKYTKRTGSPGNYRYEYDRPGDKQAFNEARASGRAKQAKMGAETDARIAKIKVGSRVTGERAEGDVAGKVTKIVTHDKGGIAHVTLDNGDKVRMGMSSLTVQSKVRSGQGTTVETAAGPREGTIPNPGQGKDLGNDSASVTKIREMLKDYVGDLTVNSSFDKLSSIYSNRDVTGPQAKNVAAALPNHNVERIFSGVNEGKLYITPKSVKKSLDPRPNTLDEWLHKAEENTMDMTATEILEEHLEKAHAGLPAHSHTSLKKKKSTAIDGGSADGGELDGVGTTSGSNSTPGEQAGVEATGRDKFSEDDEHDEKQMKTHKKPIEKSFAHRHAIKVAAIQTGDPTPNDFVPRGPAYYHTGLGVADQEASDLAKSDDFYQGGSPQLAKPAILMEQTELCKSCEQPKPRMLTACPGCGDSTVVHRPTPQHTDLSKSWGSANQPLLRRPPAVKDVQFDDE